jgi:hypothetical protein
MAEQCLRSTQAPALAATGIPPRPEPPARHNAHFRSYAGLPGSGWTAAASTGMAMNGAPS